MEIRSSTHSVLSSGVELSSPVVRGHVQHRLVNECGDLKVGRRLDHLETCDGTLGDKAGTVTLLGAPRDFDALRVGDPKERCVEVSTPEVDERSEDRGRTQCRRWEVPRDRSLIIDEIVGKFIRYSRAPRLAATRVEKRGTGLTIDVVDDHRLAHGLLVLCGRVADVVTGLSPTRVSGVRVDLLGLFEWFVSFNTETVERLKRKESVREHPM